MRHMLITFIMSYREGVIKKSQLIVIRSIKTIIYHKNGPCKSLQIHHVHLSIYDSFPLCVHMLQACLTVTRQRCRSCRPHPRVPARCLRQWQGKNHAAETGQRHASVEFGFFILDRARWQPCDSPGASAEHFITTGRDDPYPAQNYD